MNTEGPTCSSMKIRSPTDFPMKIESPTGFSINLGVCYEDCHLKEVASEYVACRRLSPRCRLGGGRA
jgi:hypothetical protein